MPLKKQHWYLVVSLMMLVCFCMATMNAAKVAAKESSASVLNDSGFWTTENAEIFRHAEEKQDVPIFFTLWGETKNVNIENADLMNTAKVDVIEMSGYSGAILSSTSPLDADDRQGCLLDENAAYDLFGSTKVIGKSLTYHDRQFIVRGILTDTNRSEEQNGILAVQALSKSSEVMDTVTISGPSQEEALKNARTFMTRNAVSGTLIRSDYLGTWSKLLVNLLPLCLLGGILIQGIRITRVGRDYPVQLAAGVILIVLFVWGYMWLFGIHPKLSSDLIPPQWSDFDFWTQTFKQKNQEVQFLLTMEKRSPEMLLISAFLGTVKYSLAALVLYFAGLKIKKMWAGGIFIGTALSWILIFAVIVLSGSSGGVLLGNSGVWLIVPVVLISAYIKKGSS